VRHHGEIARLEVPLKELARMLEPGVRDAATAGLKALGFGFVTLDLEGFRSGSLNIAAGVGMSPKPAREPLPDPVRDA
jgi:pyridinium-3,5-biscarboxylic acid mononucleotide sulfurtransferase